MTVSPVAELATFTSRLDCDALPETVRQRVKDLFLDAVASGLAGTHGDETLQINTLARALGDGDTTVLDGDRASLAGAVLLNGYLITAVTVCDAYRPALFHVTPEVVPPALAIAEREDADGKEFVAALAAGMEVSTRVALGINYPEFRRRGWHSPGVIGPFGGAAAVGRLLGFSEQELRRAFGLAGSQSAGTFAQWGTPTVKFHQSRAALSGLMAALLAQTGFVASEEVLTHPDGGIYTTYSDGGHPDVVVNELGSHWELENISFRLWPLASSIQSVVTAVFGLIEKYDLRPEQVKHLRVGLSETVYKMHGAISWENRFRALLSAPYAAAVVLHDRRCWLDQFSTERVRDPQLDAFIRERVEVRLDPSVEATGAVVDVETTTGQTYSDRRAVPKGDPADPVSYADLEHKFRAAAAGILSQDAQDELLGMIQNLESVKVRDLTNALRASRQALV
jgi:2-methylcitrate dehydratase PrpD